jgi:hypothetical protein
MKKFPYTTRPQDIKILLQKLPELEVPPGKVNAGYMKSLGFSSASTKYLWDILKMLGFIDQQDMASQMWSDYTKNKERGLVLATAIKNAYPELFGSVFCPYLEEDDTIIDIFKGEEPKASFKDLSLMVEAFRKLTELADFQDLLCAGGSDGLSSKENEKTNPNVKVDPHLQLNIQIHIDPQTPDSKIETIFKSMRKYLLDKTTTSE